MEDDLEVSVCVPLFNEEANILDLYKKICEVLDQNYERYEIICVDDGSTDNSFKLMSELASSDKKLKVVRLYRNFGQTKAMHIGIQHAKAPIIITMDGDLQNDPRDIPMLVNKLREGGYHLVCGWRKKREDKLLVRKIPSKVANYLIGHFAGLKIHDFGCTLRAYDARIIKKIKLYGEMHRFIPALVAREGGRIIEMEVRHHPRTNGESKYGLERVIKVLLDIFLLKFLSGYATRPIHFFGTMAIVFAGISSVVGVFTIYRRVVSGVLGLNLIPLVLLVMLLAFVSVIFFSIGLLAEMSTRIYSDLHDNFNEIDEIINP